MEESGPSRVRMAPCPREPQTSATQNGERSDHLASWMKPRFSVPISVSAPQFSPGNDREPNQFGDDDETLSFEKVLRLVGGCGKWQLRVFLLASFSGFCTALHSLSYGFIGATPDHWCRLPDTLSNQSAKQMKSMLIPKVNGEFTKCSQYLFNNNGSVIHVDNTTILACDKGFEYDTSEFSSTIPMQWDLVCDDAPWASTVQVAYMTGILIGSPLLGSISDRFGRKMAILIATLIFIITSPLISLSPSFYVVIVLRFILAMGSPGVYATSYVLVVEIFGEKWRGWAGNLFNIPFACGYLFLPCIAYFIRDWRTLQVALSLPAFILLITWHLLPESPRWLLRQGNVEAAEKIFREAAALNRNDLPPNFTAMLTIISNKDRQSEVEERTGISRLNIALQTLLSIFKSPGIRFRYGILCFCWAAIGMTYYGLALNSVNVSSNRYYYTIVGGLLEFPAYGMMPFLISLYGRRKPFSGCLVFGGLSLLSSLLFETGSEHVAWLTYAGKFAITCAFSLVYLYSAELMPTDVRTYAIGMASMMARIGAIVAPLIVDIVGSKSRTLPSMIFGSVALVVGTAATYLPETKGKHLPETIEGIETTKVQKEDNNEKALPLNELPSSSSN